MEKLKKVAEMLGVEIGEKFIVPEYKDNPYYLGKTGTVKGLIDASGRPAPYEFMDLMCSNYASIEKIPFKPKYGEKYWRVYVDKYKKYCVLEADWYDFAVDYCRYKVGLVFRTKKEAEEIGIPRLKEIIEEYENALGN